MAITVQGVCKQHHQTYTTRSTLRNMIQLNLSLYEVALYRAIALSWSKFKKNNALPAISQKWNFVQTQVWFYNHILRCTIHALSLVVLFTNPVQSQPAGIRIQYFQGIFRQKRYPNVNFEITTARKLHRCKRKDSFFLV